MTHTLRLAADPYSLDQPQARAAIEQAAEILRSGGTVAFPTETVYGLGANALDPAAVSKIFLAKQRPSWDPLIVHIASHNEGPPSTSPMLKAVVSHLPSNARRLMDVFWPGPLTLLLPRAGGIPEAVTAGRPRVGVRMPQHPVAQALIQAAGVPVAAPSANTFGHTSPTLASHVADDLDGRIDAILDGGETAHGLESTVLDVCEDPCIVYRPGVITLEQIQAVCNGAVVFHEVRQDPAAVPASRPSPGVGLRHYAPQAQLTLIDGEGGMQIDAFRSAALSAIAGGHKIGLMLPDRFQIIAYGLDAQIYPWGSWDDLEELGQRLFAGLRALDHASVTMILCPLPPARGIGIAVRDRLEKAARPR